MLLKTSINKKHYHIIYVFPDGTGVTSKNNNHIHQIIKEQISSTIINEQGNEEVSEKEGSLIVQESEGHSHSIEDIILKEIKDKELEPEDEVNLCYGLYKEGKDNWHDAFEDADTSEKYIKGDQWDDADKSILRSEQRTCLTINETKPKMDMLSGHFRQNRTDINLSPIEEGDARTCDIYNILIKNILQNNNYDHQETYTFENQSRLGLGFMKVYIDSENTLTGEVKVKDIYWKHGFVGVHKELDGSDSEYAGEIIPISMAKLKELYPEKAEDISKDFQEASDIVSKGIVPRNKANSYTPEYGTTLSKESLPAYDKDLLDISKKEYKLVTVQRKIYKRTPIFFNTKHNFYFNAEGMDKKDFKLASSIEFLNSINSVSNEVRETVFAGKTLLSTEISLFKEITIVPFYANKTGNYWWGKVKEVMGLQNMLNKLYSQSVDIINKCARYGIAVDSEAFENTGDFQDFIRDVNKPGFVAKMKDGFQTHIHEFQGVKYPSEIVATVQNISEKINTVLNVYPEMLGQQGRAESGVAIAQKLRQGLVGNEYLYDNFSLSKRRIGRLILKGIQIIYSPEKILRIIENQNNKNRVEINGEALFKPISMEEKLQIAIGVGAIGQNDAQSVMKMMQEQKPLPPQITQILDSMQEISNQVKRQELLDLLTNDEITRYDVVVTENTSTPTMMLSNYILLAELAAKGIPIPPSELISLMPNLSQEVKDRMLSSMQQSAQQDAEMEKKKFDTEIQKSMIAAQSKQQQTGSPLGLS